MPELPEVEIVCMGLRRLIVGKTVLSESHDSDKAFPNSPGDVGGFLLGATVVSVRRRAKVILVDLSTRYTLLVHLKMTGQLVYVDPSDERFGAGHPNASLIGALPDRSTRVTLEFCDGSRLFFNDQRKFGWMRLIPTNEIDTLEFFKRVGPEPLDKATTADVFVARIKKRLGTTVKAALLDQSVIAGVGNIYADESLWGARIHPATRVKDVSDESLRLLFSELVFVLALSIEKGGSTDKTYVNAEGKKGSYIKFARVFRREKQPCPRCSTEIVKSRVAGRGTHTCPVCQK
jgi:formamidopyrimidine-DNA glycosylase